MRCYELLASLLGARTLLGAPGLTTRNKNATRNPISWSKNTPTHSCLSGRSCGWCILPGACPSREPQGLPTALHQRCGMSYGSGWRALLLCCEVGCLAHRLNKAGGTGFFGSIQSISLHVLLLLPLVLGWLKSERSMIERHPISGRSTSSKEGTSTFVDWTEPSAFVGSYPSWSPPRETTAVCERSGSGSHNHCCLFSQDQPLVSLKFPDLGSHPTPTSTGLSPDSAAPPEASTY